MNSEAAMLAGEIKVGDVVEFEVGLPVRVVEIEDNWSKADPDPSPYALATYGKSLVFSAVYPADEPTMDVSTVYVRRERSPICGPYVCR